MTKTNKQRKNNFDVLYAKASPNIKGSAGCFTLYINKMSPILQR